MTDVQENLPDRRATTCVKFSVPGTTGSLVVHLHVHFEICEIPGECPRTLANMVITYIVYYPILLPGETAIGVGHIS